MARYIQPEDHVGVLVAGEEEKPIVINDDDILVMQTIVPYYWPKDLKLAPKAKIFFWTLHYRNLIPSLLPFPGLREVLYNHLWLFKTLGLTCYRTLLSRMKKLIDDMTDNGSHFFMDISTERDTLEHLSLKESANKIYLPVPATDYEGEMKMKEQKSVIDFCWLGRISIEKAHILVYVLKKSSEYALRNKKKIRFHILGFGELSEMVNSLDLDNEYFEKMNVQPIRFADIDNYLLNKVDLMFAMGTSALEAAKLAIPTILVDQALSPIEEDYMFRMLYERKGYDLGHTLSRTDFLKDNKSFDKCVEEVIYHYEDSSTRCRTYFTANHSLTSVGTQFENLISKCTFTFEMIDPKAISKPWLLQMYNNIRGFDR